MKDDVKIISKEEIGKGYDKVAKKIFVSNEFYNEVLSIAPEFYGDILDAGVGQGIVLKKISEQAKANNQILNLTGIDLSDHLIEMAKRAVPAAKILKADIENMPFEDNSFDFVVMVDTLPYILDPDKALGEIKRVLRIKGKFLVTVGNRRWLFRKKHVNKYDKNPILGYISDFEEMEQLLKRNDFIILDYKGADCLRFYGWKHIFDKAAAALFPFLHKRMKKIVFYCEIIK